MSTAAMLRVGACVPVTRAEGPGARYALWVQGCSIRCPGCCNPHLFEGAGGQAVGVDTLMAEIRGARPAIEGVTFLGGEPFEQAGALAHVAAGARDLGLSVMVFSGYTLEELRALTDAGVDALLRVTDVLVDGRYDARRPERNRRWAGSANQRFHYLTGRYSREIEVPAAGRPLREVEVRIDADGRIQSNGWPVWRAGRATRGARCLEADARALARRLAPSNEPKPR
jgi:anaerobic ribonucleoside-triphosphate reductase activating protein